MENKNSDLDNNINIIEKKKTILFLHGFTQNSEIFTKRLKVILKLFKTKLPSYQMLIPDAPHLLNPEQVF